ncbi:hypothetical protein EPO56_00240 [Patescibacteria group bacterium]|nr:MAG: hypothetical protein EPO56_00240 [Patescibacteria group bacterium]
MSETGNLSPEEFERQYVDAADIALAKGRVDNFAIDKFGKEYDELSPEDQKIVDDVVANDNAKNTKLH